MVADVLHRGYTDGHAGELRGVGYTFSNSDPDGEGSLTVASCGYADDVLVFAESPEALLRMHNWTRAFFGAHAFKLNTTKTKLTATGGLGALKGRFLGVDGTRAIKVSPSSYAVRYLGVMLNLDLTWEAEMARLNRAVDRVGASIRTHGMTCSSGVDAVNSYLIPQMDLESGSSHTDRYPDDVEELPAGRHPHCPGGMAEPAQP